MPQRIITSPIRLTGSVHPHQVSSLIALDAYVRRLRQLGKADVRWELSTLAGDAAVQRAVERAVVREGEDRELLGREGFSERAHKLEQEAEEDLRELLGQLNIDTSLDRWSAHSQVASRVARVAFVRLYESGVLRRETTLVDACPSCETVIDETETNEVEIDVDVLRISLALADADLEVDTAQPELLPGAVAIAVPENFITNEKSVFVPLAENELPIITVPDVDAPRPVVPAHDKWSFELARSQNLDVIDVLDSEGVVQHEGTLQGLGRFAARAAATEQLTRSGYVSGHFASQDQVRKCHRCSTQVVPMYGVHWVLSFDALAPALIESTDAEMLAFSPPLAGDRLKALAENAGSWCISQQLWSGERIPVFTCLDCGQVTVSVDEQESCGSCMGTLQPHNDILDARFIAAIVPLAMLGWPGDITDPDGSQVTLSVGRSGLETWALPIAALGLRLTGRVPFDQLTVHELTVGPDPGQLPATDLIQFVREVGAETARAALLLGDLESDRAAELLNDLANPLDGDAHVQDLVESYDRSLETLDAGAALLALQHSARHGLEESSKHELATLAAPLLGDQPNQ